MCFVDQDVQVLILYLSCFFIFTVISELCDISKSILMSLVLFANNNVVEINRTNIAIKKYIFFIFVPHLFCI